MSNNYIRAVNPTRTYLNMNTVSWSNWSTNGLYYDISNDYLVIYNWANRGYIDKNGITGRIGSALNQPSLNHCYYNGNSITFSAPNNSSFDSLLLNGSHLTHILPNRACGCAIYNDKFYYIVSSNSTSITVFETTLSTINPTNPFNTTTPTFTQTYATFQAASAISSNGFSGMCTFDTSGNFYFTTSASGVYKYSFDSSYNSTPSIFISSTTNYSTILYNPVYKVFYVHSAGRFGQQTGYTDVYNNSGELLKSRFINAIDTTRNNAAESSYPMCCDPLGNYYCRTYIFGPNQEVVLITDKYVCFKKDTQILTFQGYKRIQDLKPGDLVKTLKHEYVPIYKIGFSEIDHPCNLEERTKDQLYKCSPDNYPEVFEDLVLTGCHSILVDTIESEEQMEKMIEINGRVCETDGKYRLPVCLDEKATVYDVPGNHTIYHLALENDDYYMNYGIYANGLLVESTSKRFMDTIKMTLVE